MARPRDGKEVKQTVSFKVEPHSYILIIGKYGSFSKFVNEAIRILIFGGKY